MKTNNILLKTDSTNDTDFDPYTDSSKPYSVEDVFDYVKGAHEEEQRELQQRQSCGSINNSSDNTIITSTTSTSNQVLFF